MSDHPNDQPMVQQNQRLIQVRSYYDQFMVTQNQRLIQGAFNPASPAAQEAQATSPIQVSSPVNPASAAFYPTVSPTGSQAGSQAGSRAPSRTTSVSRTYSEPSVTEENAQTEANRIQYPNTIQYPNFTTSVLNAPSSGRMSAMRSEEDTQNRRSTSSQADLYPVISQARANSVPPSPVNPNANANLNANIANPNNPNPINPNPINPNPNNPNAIPNQPVGQSSSPRRSEDQLTEAALTHLDRLESEDPVRNFSRTRRKVIYLSAASAAFTVLSAVFGYVFKLETDLEVLNFLRRNGILHDGDDHGGQRRAMWMFFIGLPFLVLGVTVSLSVPACGYFGAKRLNSKLLGCFVGCNGCMAVGGIVSVMMLLWIMIAGIPMADNWISDCDPSAVCCGSNGTEFCSADGLPLEKFKNQFLDCALSGIPDYESRFEYDSFPHLDAYRCEGASRMVTRCPDSQGPQPDWDEEVRDFRKRYPGREDFFEDHHGKGWGRHKRMLFEVLDGLKRRNPTEFDHLEFGSEESSDPVELLELTEDLLESAESDSESSESAASPRSLLPNVNGDVENLLSAGKKNPGKELESLASAIFGNNKKKIESVIKENAEDIQNGRNPGLPEGVPGKVMDAASDAAASVPGKVEHINEFKSPFSLHAPHGPPPHHGPGPHGPGPHGPGPHGPGPHGPEDHPHHGPKGPLGGFGNFLNKLTHGGFNKAGKEIEKTGKDLPIGDIPLGELQHGMPPALPPFGVPSSHVGVPHGLPHGAVPHGVSPPWQGLKFGPGGLDLKQAAKALQSEVEKKQNDNLLEKAKNGAEGGFEQLPGSIKNPDFDSDFKRFGDLVENGVQNGVNHLPKHIDLGKELRPDRFGRQFDTLKGRFGENLFQLMQHKESLSDEQWKVIKQSPEWKRNHKKLEKEWKREHGGKWSGKLKEQWDHADKAEWKQEIEKAGDGIGGMFNEWRRHGGHGRHPREEDFSQCTMNPKAVKVIKVVHDNLPGLVSQLEVILGVKLIMTIPVVIFAFLSVFYGFRLCKYARRGYRPTFFSGSGNNLQSLSQPMIMVNSPGGSNNAESQYGNAGSSQYEQPQPAYAQPYVNDPASQYHAAYVPSGYMLSNQQVAPGPAMMLVPSAPGLRSGMQTPLGSSNNLQAQGLVQGVPMGFAVTQGSGPVVQGRPQQGNEGGEANSYSNSSSQSPVTRAEAAPSGEARLV